MAIEVRFPTGGTPQASTGSTAETVRVFTTDTIAVDDFVLIQCTSEGNGTVGDSNTQSADDSNSDFPSLPVLVSGGNAILTGGGTHPTTHTITNVNSGGTGISTGWEDLGYQVGGYPTISGTGSAGTLQGRNFNGCWVKKYTAADNPNTDNTFDVTVEVDTARDGRYLSLRMLIISGASVVAGDVTITNNIALSAMKNSRNTGGTGVEVEVQWPRPTHSDYSSSNLDGNFVAIWTSVIPPNQAPVPSATLASGSSPVAGRTDATLLSPGGTPTVSEGGHYVATGMNHSAWVYWKVYDGGTPFTTFDNEWNGTNGSRYAWDIGETGIYGTMSGTIIFKEATAAGTAHARSFPDTAETLDSHTLTEVSSHTRTFPDTVETSDSHTLTEVSSHTRTFPDTVETLDDHTLTEDTQAHARSFPDTAEAPDDHTLTEVSNHTRTFPDTAEAPDDRTFDTAAAHTRTFPDTVETIDSHTLAQAHTRSLPDTVESLDAHTLIQSHTRVLPDTTEAADDRTFTTTAAHTRSFPDTVETSDSRTLTQTHTRALPDTVETSDSHTLTELSNHTRTFPDTAEVTDDRTFTAGGAHIRTFSDTVETSDSHTLTEDTQAHTRTFPDTVEVPDDRTFTKTSSHTRTFPDTTETLDDHTLIEVSNHTRTFPDTAEAPDDRTFAVAAAHTRTFPDTVEVPDSHTLTEVSNHTRTFPDTTEAADSHTLTEDTQAHTRSFPDTAEAPDDRTFTYTDIPQVHTRTFPDTAESSDDRTFDYTLAVVVHNVFEGLDSAGANDLQTLGMHFVISDTAATDDGYVPVRQSNLVLVDAAVGEDYLTAAYVFADSLESTDTVAFRLTIVLTSETIGIGRLVGGSPPALLMEVEALALLQIYNTTLNALGVGTLSDLGDTSPQATILNNVWDSFRQQFLADHSWNGAKKSVSLSRLQDYLDVDVTPAGNRWSYAYVLPPDYLRVLRINGYERYNATQAHLQNAFEIEVVNYANSATTTEDTRCLLTDESGTINLEYIFDPGSNGIDLLGAKTTYALGLALAHHVARNFGKTPPEIAVLSTDSKLAIANAKGVDGQENTPRLRPDMNLLESRYWWRG